MERRNIVIIGGTACGPKAAARARRCDPDASITIVEQRKNISTATCGMPYFISGVIKSPKELIAVDQDGFQDVQDVELLTRSKALSIDRNAHTVKVLDGATNETVTLGYDKLVLATGSSPVVPNFKGGDLKGIFTLTNLDDTWAISNFIKTGKRKVVIIGAGLIGMEMAEAFSARGLEVTVVEALDWILPALLDFEVAACVSKHLKTNGINVLTGKRVTGFEGNDEGWVAKVRTEDAELEADLVLMSIGVKPDASLARDAGLVTGKTGGIAVNEYLQTSDPDIYAGGDCVENTHLITGQKVFVPMGSTANKHGRVIGTNVTGGAETFPGVLGTAIAKLFEYNVARVGLSEVQAKDAGYDVVTCLVPANDHAGYYPGAKDMLIKLVVDRSGGRILGGQVAGRGDTAKRIDVLATALTFNATVDDLAAIDLAYAPPYNSAMDPLHDAANVIRNKLSGLAKTVTPMEVKEKIDRGEDFILLDVRSPKEWEDERIDVPQSRLLHIANLRARIDELPADKEIIGVCKTSTRAYKAQRILDGMGFKDNKFVDGSILAWPYGTSSNKQGP
jgi:NADPH-dependent 2,4-dienoyl-CoA reductase/sulfur reductase-like enzyme/rhodanese-related sulfurtransferase